MKQLPLAGSAELIDFISRGASDVTLRDVETLKRQIPELRKQFEQIRAEKFPKAPLQFAFLADTLEAVTAGRYNDLPYVALAEVVFALNYLVREVDLIPDFVPETGFLDDSAVAATVLDHFGPEFQKLAAELQLDWASVNPELRSE